MIKIHHLLFVLITCICLNISCNTEQSNIENKPEKVKIKAPKFEANNAYGHIEKQLSFGPRVPGTKAHDSCATWLESQFNAAGTTVMVQKAMMQGAGSKNYNIKNIIASHNPSASKRILLCAHWDTRAMADQDKERQKEPIPGADDGASGVGILLEIMNVLKNNPLKNVGVDVVLFDAEDQGESGPNFGRETWCLGAQYWSKNPHVPNYKASFGVLLDMVGAGGARFPKEGVSMKHAAFFVDKIWGIAAEQGYNDFFINEEERQIVDDHVFVNELRQIPTVDIIFLTKDSPTGFGSHWHTHKDDIKIINKTTLTAVGQTLVQMLFEEDAAK
jgi:glutaminyl-peptide cyclotransferase